VQGTGLGLLGDLLFGVLGAFVGSWFLPKLGVHLGAGIINAIINATVGAILLLLLVKLLRGGRGGRRWRR
ncbi:MAG: GlsB/YeaQ/YmgE family stress response membrane protein, partial [Sphingomonas bacterium]